MANEKKQTKTRSKRKTLIILLIAIAILAVGVFVAFRIINSAHVGVDNDPEPQLRGEKRVLVAYFSWSGNLRQMARWTADETGGELFRIVPEKSYGTDYGKCAIRAKTELDKGVRPALSRHIPADIFANYDVIYLGYPVWWYDLPMPVWSFLEEYDLSGKTIIPFFSHNGSSNGANSLNRISELAGAAKAVYTQDAISIKDGNVAASEAQMRQWANLMLEKSGFTQNSAGETTVSAPIDAVEHAATPDTVTTAGSYTIELSALPYCTQVESTPVVYYISDISPEGLMYAYAALNWTPAGNVGVKMSTGESTRSNYLKPALIGDLVKSLNATIVECNTAYGGNRASTAMHRQQARDNGLLDIAELDILDEDGDMELPVSNGFHLSVDTVGSHFANYDSYLVLTHFKGHAMAGFGGAIKNISIGFGSKTGKCLIHSAGRSRTSPWGGVQDHFLESMADAAWAVDRYMGENIVYISVLNRLSVDCDCDGDPAEPDMHDICILASTDPLAIDQAAIDLIYAMPDSGSLVRRIESRNGLHTLEAAEQLGLGSRDYRLVVIGE